VAGDRLPLGGRRGLELDLELLRPLRLCLRRLLLVRFGLRVARFPLRLGALVVEALLELGEGRHAVGLLLEVEVVDLFLGEVHDLSGVLADHEPPVADHGGLRHDAFLCGLAAEELQDPAERPAQPDPGVLLGLDPGLAERRHAQAERHRYGRAHETDRHRRSPRVLLRPALP